MLFHLKTSAALMLAAYLVSDEAIALLHPHQARHQLLCWRRFQPQ
jgi:hypothetical protein